MANRTTTKPASAPRVAANTTSGGAPGMRAHERRSVGAIHKPEDHELILRVMPMPADVNSNGDIFGGWVMSQVDIAGGVTAAQRARGRVATVAVNAFQFKQPISIGDVVSFYTRVEKVGRTSVTVHVEVIAERNPTAPVVVKVTEATLTYVAIDGSGGKREVPEQ